MALIRPYASCHAAPKGPGDARPTALEVIQDQGLIGALPNDVFLITGCTSGIGVETARALYSTGALIYITARDLNRGRDIAAELSIEPSRPVTVIELRLDSFASVHAAARRFLSTEAKLNVLVNNAGIMACPPGLTIDGHELQFGTNHLGHFLLFQLLKPALLAAATPGHPSRVVSVSSTGHRYCENVPSDDVVSFSSGDSPWDAYGRSKLSNIWFANELDRRYAGRNLHALSLHPGSIKTPLQRHIRGSEVMDRVLNDPAYLAQTKSVEQGAATTVYAAVGSEWTHRGGVYLEDVGEAGPTASEGAPYRPGYSANAFHPQGEKKLWAASRALCGMSQEED